MKANMLNVVKSGKQFLKKSRPYVMGLAVAATCLMSNIAFAAGGSDVFKMIVKILGAFCLAGGAIYGIMGGISYASAKSEGDGPAMAKAQNQLYSAILLGVLGAALTAGANTIAGLINDAISL